MGLMMAGAALAGEPLPWLEIEPGLEATRFDTRSRLSAAKGDLIVLRVDPTKWDLRVLTTARDGDGVDRNVRQWCADFELSVAINAGMFQEDNTTHVGFCQIDGEIINRFANNYKSAMAIDPVDPADPTGNPDFAVASLRMASDVGEWEQARFVLPGGQSGNPFSPHYGDQFELWRLGDAFPIAWSEAMVERSTRHTLVLEPGG